MSTAGLPRIRAYRPGDEMGVAQLAALCFEESIRPYYTAEGAALFAAAIHPAEIARRQAEDALLFVAEAGEEIAGLIELRAPCHINLLFVAPDFRQCGLATALLKKGLQTMRKIHPGISACTVYSTPNAVEVYRHWGFEPYGAEQLERGIKYTPMRLKLR